MTVQPVVPFTGYAGWRYLQRTMESQQARMSASPASQRDETYFRQKVGSITTAKDLVQDRRLLKVALGTFGLDSDIANKAFIRKVLEQGPMDSKSLANRVGNKSYAALAKAFAFDQTPPNTTATGFADEILAAYGQRQFELALGAQNNDLRLALNAQRELGDLAAGTSSDATKWYSIMGSTPLRKVFETTFGLPSSFGTLDIDRQLSMLRSKAATVFGSSEVSQFRDPEKVEDLIKRFLLRSTAPSVSASSPALTLLQGGSSASSILQILIR